MQSELLDLQKVVGNMSKMLERLLGETIALEFKPAVENSFVQGDGGMIEQVVMNLSLNARDAMPRGGRLTIASRPWTLMLFSSKLIPRRTRDALFVCASRTTVSAWIPPR